MNIVNIVSVENLSYARHNRQVIHNLNLSVSIGDCVVLTGPNGTGKTTTLNLIAGLIRPTSGCVLIRGLNIHTFPLHCKKNLGFLPDRLSLYQDFTVKEYLTLVAKLHLIPKEDQKVAIEHHLEKLNIQHCQNHLIGLLSKGQQQRVGIAQVLLHKPAVLLLDEPCQGLDPNEVDSFLNLLDEYKKRSAIIFSSHNFNEVEPLCNKRLQFTHQGIKEHDLTDCTA